MKARIYKPSKSAMQSGRAHLEDWVLEYEPNTSRTPEALMGWVSSGDTRGQVKMKFQTLQDAEAFAQSKGIEYTVSGPKDRKVKPRNYGDNFRYVPPTEQDSA
ncbi:MAG: ETC complex I subunit [Alphaproteobacteria bacterium]|nr:ETC complex I subunit [Alphaproteobacteria bacterium]